MSAVFCSTTGGIIKPADGGKELQSGVGRDGRSASTDLRAHEEGKITLEEYLGRVVFYQKRPFTRAQFRRFMFAQSKPYPEMIELATQLKVLHGLKIAVVSNEAREVNAYRIRKFKLDKFVMRLFPPASSTSANPTRRSSGRR